MGYTARYNQATKAERQSAALMDAEWYMGKDCTARVRHALRMMLDRAGPKSMVRTGPMLLSFAGLQGAPARAMMLRELREWRKR